MKTSDFDFELPETLIARYPLKNRTESRLLCLSKHGTVTHHIFSDLPKLLNKNDVLIFNNTRVIPARLYARKVTGGKIEILVERILGATNALAHVKSNRSLKLPCTVILENNIEITIEERKESLFKLQFHTHRPIHEILEEVGNIPLPGYMQRQADSFDKQRYQTVYAERAGAIAAPTAGLHFDSELMQQLKEIGIKLGFITLHVGAGTFKPIIVEEIAQHHMHHEIYEISQTVSELVNNTKSSGGRVIAVGTTTVRALETAMRHNKQLAATSGETDIFIYPGFRFQCVDGLITNFHLPKSSLLMLVCAFGGYQNVMSSYAEAILQGYRFYSYGDAMLLGVN